MQRLYTGNSTGHPFRRWVWQTYEKDGKVYYLGDAKPSKDAVVQIRLYKSLKNIKYIIHSHCYVKEAPFTNIPVPCGALDEIDEVMDVVNKHYNNLELDYYAVNLNGHGCLIMSGSIDKLFDTKFVTRALPEKIKLGSDS